MKLMNTKIDRIEKRINETINETDEQLKNEDKMPYYEVHYLNGFKDALTLVLKMIDIEK